MESKSDRVRVTWKANNSVSISHNPLSSTQSPVKLRTRPPLELNGCEEKRIELRDSAIKPRLIDQESHRNLRTSGKNENLGKEQYTVFAN